jgi:hypothetical protein
MSVDEDENIILANIPSLLSDREVKTKTGGTAEEWSLREIHSTRSLPRNIQFSLIIENGSRYLRVSGKIHRETNRFSNIEVNGVLIG